MLAAADNRGKIVALVAADSLTSAEQLGKSKHRVQRRAQFVAHAGEIHAFGLIRLLRVRVQAGVFNRVGRRRRDRL